MFSKTGNGRRYAVAAVGALAGLASLAAADLSHRISLRDGKGVQMPSLTRRVDVLNKANFSGMLPGVTL
ncbi:MAG: hypothetical protein ACK58T_13960, partial [Phycisphaerae bacterium]